MKYLVTGATGYIGSMIIKWLLKEEKDVNITAIVRDERKAEARLSREVKLIVSDITDTNNMATINGDYDYIIHCASETKSKNMVDYPVETALGIVDGTKNILEVAKRCNVKSMVFLSSMEVYGVSDTFGSKRTREDELGHIDILNARSSYPMAKRMAESLCYYYYKEYGVPVKIARLAQVFGEGVPLLDNRVFAQFAKSFINNCDIILNTDGMSMGNYCEINDAVNAIMILLNKGNNGESYNVVNEANTMTIKAMAELVASDIAGGSIKVVINQADVDKLGYAPKTGLMLSGDKMSALGWKPQKSMKQMYLDLIKELKREMRL